MSLLGGVLNTTKGGVFPAGNVVSKTACWSESIWCLTLKNIISACGWFKENDGS